LGDLAFEEADLRSGIKEGGHVVGAFIVARAEEEFVVYMRCNWIRGRGFRIIRTWRGSQGDRTFKNLQSAWSFVRKFHFSGRVTVYPAGDLELRQFVGVVAQDQKASPHMVSDDLSAAIPAGSISGLPDPAILDEAAPGLASNQESVAR
jgi:hypothetical protein